MLICDCEEWKLSIEQISAAQEIAKLHGYPYTAPVFRICPWCGTVLRKDKKSLKDICNLIGCSGNNPEKCPGDPDCAVLIKLKCSPE
jgi:hypothetical protein